MLPSGVRFIEGSVFEKHPSGMRTLLKDEYSGIWRYRGKCHVAALGSAGFLTANRWFTTPGLSITSIFISEHGGRNDVFRGPREFVSPSWAAHFVQGQYKPEALTLRVAEKARKGNPAPCEDSPV